jgi:hypothetical protein
MSLIIEQLQSMWVKIRSADDMPKIAGIYWVVNMTPHPPEEPSVSKGVFFDGRFWSQGNESRFDSGEYPITISHWAPIVEMPLPVLHGSSSCAGSAG